MARGKSTKGRLVCSTPSLTPAEAQVGARARALRERSGISQHQLSQIMGVRATDLSAFECSRVKRGPRFIATYAEALGLPVEALLPSEPKRRRYARS